MIAAMLVLRLLLFIVVTVDCLQFVLVVACFSIHVQKLMFTSIILRSLSVVCRNLFGLCIHFAGTHEYIMKNV